jgi:hypothetical protein
MAYKNDLKVGQRVEFARSSDKAVKQQGVIAAISSKEPVVNIQTAKGNFETAHVDDVRVLEKPADTAARTGGSDAEKEEGEKEKASPTTEG